VAVRQLPLGELEAIVVVAIKGSGGMLLTALAEPEVARATTYGRAAKSQRGYKCRPATPLGRLAPGDPIRSVDPGFGAVPCYAAALAASAALPRARLYA
jgi:hypothetical protein